MVVSEARGRLYTVLAPNLLSLRGHGGPKERLAMITIKAASPILLAIGIWCPSSSAGADDATAHANAHRVRAAVAAQSMLGYAPVATSDQAGCCCPSASGSGLAYSTLNQQIAALSAALKETPQPAKLSAASLAEGAY